MTDMPTPLTLTVTLVLVDLLLKALNRPLPKTMAPPVRFYLERRHSNLTFPI